MPRRGWSSIATPNGWYEVIRGPRPPSVQWPLAPKGQGKGKGGKPVAAPRAPQKTPQKAQSKVGRLEAALPALGQEQSSARSALEEALKTAKAESPKQVHPQQRVAEASARVERLEAALKLLGEDDPDAEPLKIALKRAKSQAQVRPVGERLDLCLQYIARVKRQVARAEEHVREAKEAQVQMEEKLANGLRDLEALRAEASEEPRQRPQQGVAQPVMEVEPNEEIVRLRALVAELQKERVQGVEANRTKKARTLAGSTVRRIHQKSCRH